jgi:hypothetical protein
LSDLTSCSEPSDRLLDRHVKSHLFSLPDLKTFPTAALTLLHDYESRGILPPQKTYTRLISRLLQSGMAVSHAHAWDLFAHMRYVAHGKPDAFLYAVMIRACASRAISLRGDPERALDLWTEMTVDSGIPPTAHAYTAVILACARSGERKFVHEGFRLAREMLDAHRDARGRAQFTPDAALFCALLEGAKRVGDLARARWILAEMVKQSIGENEGDGAVIVDAANAVNTEAMTHVFHTYAAYKPAFQRSMTNVKEAPPATTPPSIDDEPGMQNSDVDTSAPRPEPEQEQKEQSEPGTDVADTTPDDAFTRLPPQSHAEVLYEANALFARILADRSAAPPGLFGHVTLTTRLLNAYLAVLYAHAPFETWAGAYRTLFGAHGVERSATSFIELLERCARTRKEDGERTAAVGVAEEAWAEWRVAEERWRAKSPVYGGASNAEEGNLKMLVKGIEPRTIERAWAAMIRMYAL